MPPELDKTPFSFSDAQFVARYAEGPPRMVPGFADMHRMTSLLLAERVPEKGRVLVLGAGGGLELKAFAQAYPGWTFDGVDPSLEMLRLAELNLGRSRRAPDCTKASLTPRRKGCSMRRPVF